MGQSFSKIEKSELTITYPEQVGLTKNGRKTYSDQEYLYYKPTKKYIFNKINSDTMVFRLNKENTVSSLSIYTSQKHFREICTKTGRIFESQQQVDKNSLLIIRVDLNQVLKEIVYVTNIKI